MDWTRNAYANFHDGQFNMDLNTLMFISRHNKMPMAPKRAPNISLGPCYNCSKNHLIIDCLYPRQPRQTNAASVDPALARYCLECGIKYLVSDCPLNPEKKGKVALNLLETIPSSSDTESEGAKPFNVAMRAQSQQQETHLTIEEEKSERSSPNSWKARRQRQVATKKHRDEKAHEEEKDQKKESLLKGGSILAEKVFEPLKAMLDAYEARLRPNQTQEERYGAYSNPKIKTKCLEFFKE